MFHTDALTAYTDRAPLASDADDYSRHLLTMLETEYPGHRLPAALHSGVYASLFYSWKSGKPLSISAALQAEAELERAVAASHVADYTAQRSLADQIDPAEVAEALGLEAGECPVCRQSHGAMKFYTASNGARLWKHHHGSCDEAGGALKMARAVLGSEDEAFQFLTDARLLPEEDVSVGEEWNDEQLLPDCSAAERDDDNEDEDSDQEEDQERTAWYLPSQMAALWNACGKLTAASPVAQWLKDERGFTTEALASIEAREARGWLPGLRKGAALMVEQSPALVNPIRDPRGNIANLQLRFVSKVTNATTGKSGKTTFVNGGNPGATEDSDGAPYMYGDDVATLARASVLVLVEGGTDTNSCKAALMSVGRNDVAVMGALAAGAMPATAMLLRSWKGKRVLIVPDHDRIKTTKEGTRRLGVFYAEQTRDALIERGAEVDVMAWSDVLDVLEDAGLLEARAADTMREDADANDLMREIGVETFGSLLSDLIFCIS